MFNTFKEALRNWPETAKWCAYALVLLAPGSFVVVPLLLLGRRLASHDGFSPNFRRRASDDL